MEQYKAAPLGFTAADVSDLPSARPLLRDFPTPLVTLSESAVAHNLATMAAWCREAGVGIAPHGKTTMSRELWNRQLEAGAWGITVATPWQASVALGWGVPRVLLANALVQPAALRALAADAGRLTVWADSTRAVEIMTEALSGVDTPAPLDVLVELGGAGGRTGARGVEAALAVASAVAASPRLRLAGVAGYEGALAHDASPESLAHVGDYLDELLALHDAIEAAGLYAPDDAVILTAGGSAYFDQVADALAPRRDHDGSRGRRVEVLLRSGAYITHDDGHYREITPLGRIPSDREFRAAIHGWATVVSHPEPGLVLVDAGKRDLPYDEGLPIPQAIRRFGAAAAEPLDGAVTTALNDQHAFVRVPEDAVVEVGDVIRFGLSHPCTTFDKWRALAVVDDALAPEPRVIGLLDTAFG
ncbi:alanine racemase [Leifsonia sp. TF02-11]|uniref:alanine racemase n=1 Tax=Leifsonia sp. TF02-11 TaxID=2815212 RepID=UPI001AA0EFA7|nr:alanine racemase [Leifsonia sp. TF02-11]MBO1737671.1 alanine racemase [Leifsonia sp. TF02-11]